MRVVILVLLLGALTALSFYIAQHLNEDGPIVAAVQGAGIWGAIAVGIVGGINPLLPFPPATFTPIFTVAGLGIPLTILGFTIGTTLADIVAYAIGRAGSRVGRRRYPKTYAYSRRILTQRRPLAFLFATAYVIFVPLPNEFFLVPFGLTGFSFRLLIPALLIGNFIHHTLLVIGYQQIFQLLTG